jgi:type IV pilus assembly protein PilW
MEMRHRQIHTSLRGSNQGFTMIELLVAMVVSLLAMAAIYSTFLAQHRSYQVQTETTDMQQNIMAAMYYMQREIRMAGSNPFKSLPLTNFSITSAGQNSITFTEDVRGPAVGTLAVQMAPDGDAGDPDENITYALNGTDLVRTDNNAVPPNAQIVAQDINWLDFVYLDDTGAPTAILADIRSMEITIVARTNDPLLYGSKNNSVYWNQRQGMIGAQSFGPAGDNVSRRRLTTKIYCRNLDL